MIGTNKRTVITCAHNLIGTDEDTQERPTSFEFHRGEFNRFTMTHKANEGLRFYESMQGQRWRSKKSNVIKGVFEGQNRDSLWQIHPGWQGRYAKYDVALIRLPERCEGATATIGFLDIRGKLPSYCRVDGYPKLELEDAAREARESPEMIQRMLVANKDISLRSAFSSYRSSQMYGGYHRLPQINTLDKDADWLHHCVYATQGQSGAPLFVANARGQQEQYTMFGLHRRGTAQSHTQQNQLMAVVLGGDILKWIYIGEPKMEKEFPNWMRKLAHGSELLGSTIDPKNDALRASAAAMGL